MEYRSIPRPGEIYNHFKDKPYQIITVATHTETGESMVVYQALYGDFKTYVRSLEMFLSEVDREKFPDVKQKFRFELLNPEEPKKIAITNKNESIGSQTSKLRETVYPKPIQNIEDSVLIEKDEPENITVKNTEVKVESLKVNAITEAEVSEGSVNSLLLKFLDAGSYNKKLEVLTSNLKHMNDRIINDMAVSLDCTIEEGPLDQRIQELIFCLQAMCRFEDRRLR